MTPKRSRIQENKDLHLLKFMKDIFSERPKTVIIVSVLYFIAGILEIFSMAMILPVLMGLFEADHGYGAAEKFLSALNMKDLSLQLALIWITVFMSARGCIMFLADLLIARIVSGIEAKTRMQLIDNLLRSKWSFINSKNLGTLPNLILRETERYALAVLYLGRFLSAFLISCALIASSIFASWHMCIMFVLSIIPYLIISRIINNHISNHANERMKSANDISSSISECILHLKYIKSSSLEKFISTKIGAQVEQYTHHFFNAMLCNIQIKYFPEVFGVIIISALVVLSRNYIGTSPADIVFFLLLMFRGYRQISGLQGILANLTENIPSYKACREIIKDSALNKEEDTQLQLVKKHENKDIFIKLDIDSFSYSSDRSETLSNIHLSIPKSGLIAIAGLSGAGKSTIVDIILGLITIPKGSIKVNVSGNNKNIDIQLWRKKIGLVPQEPFLISGTVKENILIHTDIDDTDHLKSIAKMAHIDKFIEDLPAKYETNVGLINTGFSGGQKQRIALARAIAHNPDLLILDEATSALDAKTTISIMDTIKDISKNKLVLMIAHNTELLKEADKIYLLEYGTIIEQGSFNELKDKKAFQSYLRKNDF